jgi:hypothetical protein
LLPPKVNVEYKYGVLKANGIPVVFYRNIRNTQYGAYSYLSLT